MLASAGATPLPRAAAPYLAPRPPRGRLATWSAPRGRVLILAAHPDDETLGCGGVARLHRLRGDEVAVVFATDGEAGAPPSRRGPALAARRRGEARAACRALGVAPPEFWGYPDGGLRGAASLAGRLLEALERERPAVVYRPSEDDPHPDHRALARAFRRARRGWRGRLDEWRYEVDFLPRPDAVADVSAVAGAKLRALACHRSQGASGARLGLARRALAFRGLLAGAQAGEAFRRPERRA